MTRALLRIVIDQIGDLLFRQLCQEIRRRLPSNLRIQPHVQPRFGGETQPMISLEQLIGGNPQVGKQAIHSFHPRLPQNLIHFREVGMKPSAGRGYTRGRGAFPGVFKIKGVNIEPKEGAGGCQVGSHGDGMAAPACCAIDKNFPRGWPKQFQNLG